jgi:hypothetical protein
LRWCRVRAQLRTLVVISGLKSPAPPRGQGDQALKPPASHVANRTIGIDDHAIANSSDCGEVDPHNAHRITPPNAAQPRKVVLLPSAPSCRRWPLLRARRTITASKLAGTILKRAPRAATPPHHRATL